MKIVIDVPEYIYKLCQCHGDSVYGYIAKGTPLPDGAEILTKEAYSDLCIRAANSCTTTDSSTVEPEKCSDCISRAYIEPIVEELENICINVDEYILSLLSRIKNAPSVEPERKPGKWIKHERAEESNGRWIPNYECNQCHAWKLEDSDYCPDCGAKMVEPQESEEV